ncbi:ABC-three component system protein [Pseudomonas guariconensis]|uniref:ABC-three component system protein n=1 Tax=Pseudomonas guariconensis TaxID=1288410 RepID=UPI0034D4EE97
MDATPPKKSKRNNGFSVKRGVIPPSSQVLLFHADQWEKLIEDACRNRALGAGAMYVSVKRLGGAGDGGRDVEARLVPALSEGQWDLFQGKHYDHPLTPSDVFKELVKFFQHLEALTYPSPRYYYLCAPRGVGNDLHNLLAKPNEFKQRLLGDWRTERTGLKGRAAELTPEIEKLILAFDFRTIMECQTRDILEWHALDRKAHFELFGFEAQRGDDPFAPVVPSAHEQIYVEELLKVYSELTGDSLSLEETMDSDSCGEHFKSQRSLFYCAEGLKTFSRDTYGEAEFDALLDVVLTGINPKVKSPRHKTGLDRLEAATDGAQQLVVNDSALSPNLRPGDLPGTCHHLVNQRRLKWVK